MTKISTLTLRFTVQVNNIQESEKSKGDIPKVLPAWITGDLENTDKDDYFVSEDESEKRILIILKFFSTILLVVSSILVVKCFNNSSFSLKIKVIHLSNGKYSDKLQPQGMCQEFRSAGAVCSKEESSLWVSCGCQQY